MDIRIRPLTTEDEPFLWEMLYQSIHVPEGEEPPPRELLHEPELSRYVRDWGLRPGDAGYVAVEADTARPVGAVWLRLLTGENRGYGWVDDETPELAIAVLPDCRGRGIGTRLLTHLLASEHGSSSISLSVSADNPARRLYERHGFVTVEQGDDHLTMKRG
jgi:ribosomal protein S18 acetylase RimI-like enzyme